MYKRQDQAPQYYLNDETAKMAQEIFDNKELRMLFDAARDAVSYTHLRRMKEAVLQAKIQMEPVRAVAVMKQ